MHVGDAAVVRRERWVTPCKGLSRIEQTIALVYFNAGDGHRAAARAIKAELDRDHPEWNTVLVDLFEVLDPEKRFKRMTGFAPESYPSSA